MDHPVVAWRCKDGHGRAGNAGPGVNGLNVVGQQTLAALRFVDRGDPAFREAVDNLLVGALDVLDDDARGSRLMGHSSSSTVRGNTVSNPSAYLAARPPAWPPELRRKWFARFSATFL